MSLGAYIVLDRKTFPRTKVLWFDIHDNVNRPFVVLVTDSYIAVYKNAGYHSDDARQPYEKIASSGKPLLTLKYQKVFLGVNTNIEVPSFVSAKEQRYIGHTMLVQEQKHNSYVYIGTKVYRFSWAEAVTSYSSNLIGNDVPYPLAKSRSWVLFLEEQQATSRNQATKTSLSKTTIDISDTLHFQLLIDRQVE